MSTVSRDPLSADPIMQSGRTLIPLCFVGESLGAKVDYAVTDDESSSRTFRLFPPYVISEQPIDCFIDALENSLTGRKR
jgi:acetylornithine/succinyldiaminopimelate/putrescine aminotransferase